MAVKLCAYCVKHRRAWLSGVNETAEREACERCEKVRILREFENPEGNHERKEIDDGSSHSEGTGSEQ